jgi:hypothetical protein
MRLLIAEAIPPVNPVTTLALAALFAFCALIVAIGMVKLVDAISRAFFGTVGGAIGWIPFAGKVVKHSLHKIEQKISHSLGQAERKLDAGVAMTWNNCAHLVAWTGAELEGLAKGAWHLAQQAKGFVTHRVVTHVVRVTVKPVRAVATNATHAAQHAWDEARAVSHSVAHGVYPRLQAAEWEIEHVLEPTVAGLRARTRALEHGGTRLWRWLRTHPQTVATGAFVGAVSFALTRLGGGWIRCANWRKLGRRVCRMPMTDIDALLGLFVAVEVIENLPTLVRIMQGVARETAEGIKELADV